MVTVNSFSLVNKNIAVDKVEPSEKFFSKHSPHYPGESKDVCPGQAEAWTAGP